MSRFIKILIFLLLILGAAYIALYFSNTIGGTKTQEPSNDSTGIAVFPEPKTPENTVQAGTVTREMRGVWISTAWNLDWPSKPGLSVDAQKQEFITTLDSAKSMGINAVMVQVRPMSDSLYPSLYYPWSQYLTGKQGQNPGYDPLEFMVYETAKRDLDFYAWFNPFRVCTSEEGYSMLSANNPALARPEWMFKCSKGARWLNPGIPEARQFVMDGIMEVVKKYSIDGVIIDDYFYPYPSYGSYSDNKAFSKYGTGFKSIGDWRRNSINTFVKELHSAIKSVKSDVSFGISPFGIWKNSKQDSAGSDTNGMSSYDTIYADSKKWIDEESVDFIAPQIYWPMNYSNASYKTLVNWWAEQVKGKNVILYIGQAASRIGSASPSGWADPDEYPNQIIYNRSVPEVKGSIHFSIKSLMDNKLGIKDILQNKLYKSDTQP